MRVSQSPRRLLLRNARAAQTGCWAGNQFATAATSSRKASLQRTQCSFAQLRRGRDLTPTIKYSSAGVPLCTNRYTGWGNGYNIACAVAVDSNGHVIATGRSPGSEGTLDYATVKYVSVPSPALTGLQLTSGTFQMRVDDVLQPGTLVIEASANLAGWSPVFTNTAPSNVLFYTDPDAVNHLGRYYRAFQFP